MSCFKCSKAWTANACWLCAAVLLAGYATIPDDAGPEYSYTVTLLFQRAFFPLLLLGFVLRDSVFRLFSSLRIQYKVIAILGTGLLIVPFCAPPAAQIPWQIGYMLSVCWTLGLLCIAIVFFASAAQINNIFSGIICLAGSFLFALSIMEGYLLWTPQPGDGLVVDTNHSKYVLSGQADLLDRNLGRTAIGDFPKASGAPVFTAHRILKFDRELFDVRYGFDMKGRRVTPTSDGEALAEVLLFGCSFTFGWGLEDKETWPWKLGELLGPEWRISNYAYKGFGPQQMLSLLEEGMIETPSAPRRIALFLAIEHQIRRNAGLLYQPSVRYALRGDGSLERDGFTTDSPYTALFFLTKYFNGSQFARHLSGLMIEYIVKMHHDEFVKTYLVIIEKSARLLREKYETSLTVLLWPDVEYLEADLQQRGIATLRVRTMFPDWDATKGENYFIDSKCEAHPNSKATSELAEGLAAYFRPLLKQTEDLP